MFTYKFDSNSYLYKFKARLVVRGDFYVPNEKDTYIATLVLRIFRALIAIAAYFNLEIKQFDAINAFGNTILNELIYIYYAKGIEELKELKTNEV